MTTIKELRVKLKGLKEEHYLLSENIARLTETPLYDQLAVQRLKKKKLYLKDQILKLETKIVPDIIA